MDLRIEGSEFKLTVVEWAIHGMVSGDYPATLADFDCVLMLVQEIRKDLREGIDATLKSGPEQKRKRAEMKSRMKVIISRNEDDTEDE